MDKQKTRALAIHLKGRLKGRCARFIAFENPDFYEAVEFPGKPVPCPMHLDDGVRITFDENGNDTGGFYCPSCGRFSDVIAFLMWANNFSFFEALDAIQEWLERYERSIRTGIPDKTTHEMYMRLPLPRRIQPKINRFKRFTQSR